MSKKSIYVIILLMIISFSSHALADDSLLKDSDTGTSTLEDYDTGIQTIFFDLSTEGFFGLMTYSPAGFSELYEDLESRGYTVEDNFMTNYNYGFISNSTLNRLDTLVIINPKRTLQSDEVLNLNTFVKEGGNLIVICDSANSVFYSNQILDPYGLLFKREYLLNAKIDVSNIGVSNANASGGSLINLSQCMPVEELNYYTDTSDIYEKNDLFRINGTYDVSGDSLTGNENIQNEQTILIGKNIGKGKIIALGNKDFMKNSSYEENKNLLYFILNYLESEKYFDLDIKCDPGEFEIPLKDTKVSLVKFCVTNNETVALNSSVEVPEIIEEVVIPSENNFSINAEGSKELYLHCQDLNGKFSEYGYIRTTIKIKVWQDGFVSLPYTYEIPVEINIIREGDASK